MPGAVALFPPPLCTPLLVAICFTNLCYYEITKITPQSKLIKLVTQSADWI